MNVVAQAQKQGGKAAYIDAEHAMDPEYAAKLGVNIHELLISQPSSGEEGLNILVTAPADADARNWHGPYLKQFPTDPWGHPYHYVYPGVKNPQDYDLFSFGTDGIEGTSDDIGNWKK